MFSPTSLRDQCLTFLALNANRIPGNFSKLTIDEGNQILQTAASNKRLSMDALSKLSKDFDWKFTLDFKNTAVLNNFTIQKMAVIRCVLSVSLSGCKGFDGNGLNFLNGLPHLQSLDLSKTKVDDYALLSVQTLPSLRILNLSDLAVTDRSIEHILAFSKLERLVLSKTKVTDEGIKKLASKTDDVPRLQHLQELHLVSLQLTDKCVEYLTGFKELTLINFGPSTSLTSRGLANLKKMLQENPINNTVKSNSCNEITITKSVVQCHASVPNLNSNWDVATVKSYLLEPPEEFRARDRKMGTFFGMEKAKKTGAALATRSGKKIVPKVSIFDDFDEPSIPTMYDFKDDDDMPMAGVETSPTKEAASLLVASTPQSVAVSPSQSSPRLLLDPMTPSLTPIVPKGSDVKHTKAVGVFDFEDDDMSETEDSNSDASEKETEAPPGSVELSRKSNKHLIEPIGTPLQSQKALAINKIEPIELKMPVHPRIPKVNLVEMAWQQGLSDQSWRKQLEERQQSIQEKRRKIEQLSKPIADDFIILIEDSPEVHPPSPAKRRKVIRTSPVRTRSMSKVCTDLFRLEDKENYVNESNILSPKRFTRSHERALRAVV